MAGLITVLSLGAGVQSTAVLLMAERGDIERPQEAIFADTGWEPDNVYTHLDWLRGQTSIPITTVSAGNLRDAAMQTESRFVSIPLYVTGQDGKRGGMLRRQCTREFKVAPIRKRVGALAKAAGKGTRVRQLFGISLDEMQRMRTSDVKYIDHVYPLVDLRLTRTDCLLWLERNGYPRPPKSACIGCPFHDNARWAAMKRDDPAAFADAVAFDRDMRDFRRGQKGGVRGQIYLHRSLQPLDQVDLTTAVERGQMSLFGDECEGMCGV